MELFSGVDFRRSGEPPGIQPLGETRLELDGRVEELCYDGRRLDATEKGRRENMRDGLGGESGGKLARLVDTVGRKRRIVWPRRRTRPLGVHEVDAIRVAGKPKSPHELIDCIAGAARWNRWQTLYIVRGERRHGALSRGGGPCDIS